MGALDLSRAFDTVNIGNQHIPTVTRPKILGVTFDNMLTFCAYGKSMQNKMQARTNILKSLAGSSWGKDKETLIITYKAIGRSIANYAAPIWSNLAHQAGMTSRNRKILLYDNNGMSRHVESRPPAQGNKHHSLDTLW